MTQQAAWVHCSVTEGQLLSPFFLASLSPIFPSFFFFFLNSGKIRRKIVEKKKIGIVSNYSKFERLKWNICEVFKIKLQFLFHLILLINQLKGWKFAAVSCVLCQDSWPPEERISIRGQRRGLTTWSFLCSQILLKYNRDRESFWHRHQKGTECPLANF